MAKFKKGSQQAKDFMARLRASRGKKTIGAVKKKKSAPKKKKLLATESKSLQATLKKKKLALPHGYELKKRKLSGLHSGKNYRMKIGANITRAGEIKALKKFAKQRKSKLHIKVANIIAVNTDKNQFPVNYMTEVVKYGCSSGIVPQLIYYTDTIRFLKAYQKEILEILGDLMDDMGVKSPSDLFGNNWDNSDPFATENNNKNLLAWFGFEEATRHLGADLGYDI